MIDIVIVGASGCGREVYEMARETFSAEDYRIKGFLSDNLNDLAGFAVDAPILDTIDHYAIQPNDRFLLAIGDINGKKQVLARLKQRGAQFISLIHPLAKIFPSAVIGQGVIIYPFVMVSSNVAIGDYCLLNAFSGCGHDAVMGDYSVLCPYSVLLGWAKIGEDSLIATHATVAPKKQLGKRVKVSANSSALRNAPDDAFICGVPGRML